MLNVFQYHTAQPGAGTWYQNFCNDLPTGFPVWSFSPLHPLSFSALAFRATWLAPHSPGQPWLVLTGAFCSISTDLHHLHLPPFSRGKVGILYDANLSLTIPNSRVFPIMEPSQEYLPDHLFSTFTAPQPSQRPRDWGATVIVRKVRSRSSGCLCSPPPHPDLLVSTVATYGTVSALLLSPF